MGEEVNHFEPRIRYQYEAEMDGGGEGQKYWESFSQMV